MEACTQLLRRWQTTSGLPQPEFTELVTARVSIRNKEMLWLFQVFALTAGLYVCQVWATSSLTYDSSKITPAHVLHLGSLKVVLLGVKKGTILILMSDHCVLRKSGQMPIFLLIQMHHTSLEQFTLFKLAILS
jgi:hypothetical protein